MYFAIKIFDNEKAVAGRPPLRAEHLSYLEQFEAQTMFAGPILTDDRTKELGSHRLIEFEDRAAAEKHIADEPYVIGGLQYGEVIEHWSPSVDYTWRDCPRVEGNVQYLIQAMDKPDSAGLRDKLRAEHEAYQAKVEQLYITRGPILDSNGGQQIGSLMIIDVADLAAAREFWDNEPFAVGGLFDKVEFYGWRFGRVFDRFGGTG